MVHRRRVTLRCICDDLTSDWDDVGQLRDFRELRRLLSAHAPNSDIGRQLDRLPTTCRAAHPIVTSFYSAFETAGDEARRESISGLTSPHWWKQKSSRWRGAATDADVVGRDEVWLCAGGLRADGDKRDFYREFTDAIGRGGADVYLPTDEDRRVQDVERSMARQTAWLNQVRLAALVCVTECASEGTPRMQHIAPPPPRSEDQPLAHVEFGVETIDDSGEAISEVTVTIRDHDRQRPKLVTSAANAIRSAIAPAHDDWRVLPGAEGAEIWATLVAPEELARVQAVANAGTLPVDVADCRPKLGVRAHYTRRDRIVGASIEGDAVEALCGRWFVPTTNPDDRPICPTCREAHTNLPG